METAVEALVTIPEASLRTGIHQNTLRRWARKGIIHAEQRKNAQNGKQEWLVDSEEIRRVDRKALLKRSKGGDTKAEIERLTAEKAALETRVETLEENIAKLQEQVVKQQSEIEKLTVENAELKARVEPLAGYLVRTTPQTSSHPAEVVPVFPSCTQVVATKESCTQAVPIQDGYAEVVPAVKSESKESCTRPISNDVVPHSQNGCTRLVPEGFSLIQKKVKGNLYWQATRRVNGAKISIHVGSDPTKAQEKIKAWLERNSHAI